MTSNVQPPTHFSDEVQGHAVNVGRVFSEDTDDVAGHAVRVKADGPDGEDTEGHGVGGGI